MEPKLNVFHRMAHRVRTGEPRHRVLLMTLMALLIVLLICGTVLISKKCSSSKSIVALPYDTELEEYMESVIISSPMTLQYGLPADKYDIITGTVESGETFSKLLNGKFGTNIGSVNQLVEKSKGKFDLRQIRAGNQYAAFLSPDSTAEMQYFVYEKSAKEYVVFTTTGKLAVKSETKDVITRESYAEGVIKSSLYSTIYENNLSEKLAADLDDIFKWTIDFFALQKGDNFKVIYEEQFIDTISIGVSRIYGAVFNHGGKDHWAFRFEQGDETGYWDQNDKNLRKNFLLSPLSFKARVSSRFGMRIHPITRKRRQHNGVDYAAPSGTPVFSVADGVVVRKGWDSGGGGNMLRIRHAQGIESGYLHLRGYATGISQGTRVRQGQLIGYVGSTGASTGPHLDYRIWQNGKNIDPLKIPSIPSDPIKESSKAEFTRMKNDVYKVMEEYQSARKL